MYLCTCCFLSCVDVIYKVTHRKALLTVPLPPIAMVTVGSQLMPQDSQPLGLPSCVFQCTLQRFFPGDGLPTVMCQSSHQGPRFNLLWVPLWNSKTSDISVHQAPFVVRCILVLVSYATRFTFSSHLGANVLSLLGHLHIVACGQFVLNRMERALCPLPAGCPCE